MRKGAKKTSANKRDNASVRITLAIKLLRELVRRTIADDERNGRPHSTECQHAIDFLNNLKALY